MKFVTPGELKVFFIISGIMATLAGIITFLVLILTAPPPEEKRLPVGNPFFEKNPVLPKWELSLMDFWAPAPLGRLTALKPAVWRSENYQWTNEEIQKELVPPEKLMFYSLPEKAEKEMEAFVKGISP